MLTWHALWVEQSRCRCLLKHHGLLMFLVIHSSLDCIDIVSQLAEAEARGTNMLLQFTLRALQVLQFGFVLVDDLLLLLQLLFQGFYILVEHIVSVLNPVDLSEDLGRLSALFIVHLLKLLLLQVSHVDVTREVVFSLLQPGALSA